jgi:hypothetical protein
MKPVRDQLGTEVPTGQESTVDRRPLREHAAWGKQVMDRVAAENGREQRGYRRQVVDVRGENSRLLIILNLALPERTCYEPLASTHLKRMGWWVRSAWHAS